MKKNFFSVMIVPHDHKKVFSFKLPSWISCSLLCTFIIGVFGIWIFVMQYQELKSENLEMQVWKKMHAEEVETMLMHAREVEYLKKQVMGIKRLEAKVNTLSTELKNSKLPSPPLPYASVKMLRSLGRGGPDLRIDPDYPDLQKKVESGIVDLRENVNIGEKALSSLKDFLENQLSITRVTPNRWPLRGWISSRYGWRTFRGKKGFHTGIDIATYEGAPIRAAADGKVVFSGWKGGESKGYGKLIILDHGRGIQTYYGHNSENLVNVGDFVKKGGVVAKVGSTGHASGPHLHYEVRVNEKHKNPFKFLY